MLSRYWTGKLRFGQVGGSILQNIVDGDFGLVVQFHKRPVGAAGGGDGVVFHPCRIEVAGEIVSGLWCGGRHASPSEIVPVSTWEPMGPTSCCRSAEPGAPRLPLGPVLRVPADRPIPHPVTGPGWPGPQFPNSLVQRVLGLESYRGPL